MNKLRTFLWFDDQAEEAVDFYTSIFEDARVGTVTRYGEAGPGEPGKVMTIGFELNGHPFVALNGGPMFEFSSAISFVIDCQDQSEVDHYWDRLGEDGEYGQCGWLTDKFGITWQVVPVVLYELVGGSDAASQRATEAMLKMTKLEIAPLKAAYERG